jgi:hypothetical protein
MMWQKKEDGGEKTGVKDRGVMRKGYARDERKKMKVGRR